MDETTKTILVLVETLIITITAGYFFVKWIKEWD
jgi:hypothetical protein